MAKSPTIHSYSDRASFDRLMILLATLVKYPGVGSRGAKNTKDQDSLETLRHHMQAVADDLNMPFPIYSVHTLRKDLVTLRNYGILARNRHDWGYYLGTGAMSREELQVALNALASQAAYQGDSRARCTYDALSQRLKSLNLETKGTLLYPVRAHFNRAIVHTDPEEMMRKQKNRNTLFHNLELLETAIVQGLPIELYLSRNPYSGTLDYRHIYPLQLLYHDVAWYLVMEDQENGHLAITRVDRFTDYCKVLNSTGRGLNIQTSRLQLAHKLLEAGWGLFLGDPEEQQAELQGRLTLETVKVRFFPPVIPFILEGDRRHSHQSIHKGPKDSATGQPSYVDYSVKLPPRSLNEFCRWVYRFMNGAQILAPTELADKHRQVAVELVQRFNTPNK